MDPIAQPVARSFLRQRTSMPREVRIQADLRCPGDEAIALLGRLVLGCRPLFARWRSVALRACQLFTLASTLFAASGGDPLADLVPPPSEPGWRCPVRFAATISQGNGGTFSHTDCWNCFAWDYGVAVGTPVVAARSGIVEWVRTDSSIGGGDRRFLADANRISIRHSDDLRSVYLHLDKNRTLVRVGEYVLRGELIGYSGDTGFASMPHLHFTATAADGTSVAIRFSDFAPDDGVPAHGDQHGPAAPPVVPQATIQLGKRLLRAAGRAHGLDRPEIGLALLVAQPKDPAAATWFVGRQLAAYRDAFQARLDEQIAAVCAAPGDDLAAALRARQIQLALAKVPTAKDVVARLAARALTLPAPVAKAAAAAGARDLLAALQAEVAEDAAAAGGAYIAAIRRNDAVRAEALIGLRRLIAGFTDRCTEDITRLDNESARCLPQHRARIRKDAEATISTCLRFAGYWKTHFPDERIEAEALVARVQTAFANVSSRCGKR